MEATNSAAAPPLPSLEQDTPARRRDAARQVATPRKCVSDVMKELSDMEERLQSSVKRQRLAIQDSGLVDDVPPRRPLKPQAARKSRNVVRENLANGVRMATSVDEIEHAPSLDTDAIAAANDIEADADDREQEAEEELAERGAARPPPVNSNLLPLPWKGRIGYVGGNPNFCHARKLTVSAGLSQHVSSRSNPACFQFPYLQDRVYHPTPPSFDRPISARTSH